MLQNVNVLREDILILTVLAWLLDKDKQGALGLFITDEQLTKKQLLHNFS